MTSTKPKTKPERKKPKVPFNPEIHSKQPEGLDFEPLPKDLIRFLKKITIDTVKGCWIWSHAYRDDKGYGQFRFKKRIHWSHRWSYAAFRRPLVAGLTVEHKCRNPSCCNPWHLELLTNVQNVINGNNNRRLPPENNEHPDNHEVPF